MVQIHVKQIHEEHQFLYDCSCASEIDAITRDLINIHNLQITLQHLVLELEQRLYLYGPSENPEENTDGDGKRFQDVGAIKACRPDATVALTRALSEAKAYASKDQVVYKRPLSPLMLKDHIKNIEREVTTNYSLTSKSQDSIENLLSGISKDLELLHEDTTQIWWAGKRLIRDKKLCDHIGKNEKTKIVVKLLPDDINPPPHRSPTATSVPQAAIAFDQPKEKKDMIYDSSEDLLLNQSWADPKSLKFQFHGLPSVRYK